MYSDSSLLETIRSLGLSMSDLFLVNGEVYASSDAGEFSAKSTYSLVCGIATDVSQSLVNLLRRLGKPEYRSLREVDGEIQRSKEWESMYLDFIAGLSQYGKHCELDDGDFLVVDDDYGYHQHKIECVTLGWFRPEISDFIQTELKKYLDIWEVIVVGKASTGRSFALSIYKERIDEHDLSKTGDSA